MTLMAQDGQEDMVAELAHLAADAATTTLRNNLN